MQTRETIETALDAGKLRLRMNNGNLWRIVATAKHKLGKRDLANSLR